MSLLPQETLIQILRETGAFGDDGKTRIRKGEYRKFGFGIKKKSEFDLAIFEGVFDSIVSGIQTDINDNYMKNVSLSREPSILVDMNKYQYREQCFCSEYTISEVQSPLLFYVSQSAYYAIYNEYLGGVGISSQKQSNITTDIEILFYQTLCEAWASHFTSSFSSLVATTLQLKKSGLTDSEQKVHFKELYMISELSFQHNQQTHKIVLALPTQYLSYVKERLESLAQKSVVIQDPMWQTQIKRAYEGALIDLTLSLGSFQVPFAKAKSLKVGDFVECQNINSSVEFLYNDKTRMTGTLGVVGENYAVKIDLVK